MAKPATKPGKSPSKKTSIKGVPRANPQGFLARARVKLDDPLVTVGAERLVTDVGGYIDTGNYVMNAMYSGSIYGGLPRGKFAGLAGESQTGKSFFAFNVAKTLLNTNPNAAVIFIDTEAAYTTESMDNWFGQHRDRIMHIPLSLIEDCRKKINEVLDDLIDNSDTTEVFLVVDSLGMMTSLDEMGTVIKVAEAQKADVGRMQKLIKAMFRTVTLRMALAKATGLVTMHTYPSFDKYTADQLAGGRGVLYAADNIQVLGKSKIQHEVKDSGGKKVKIQTGSSVSMGCYKSRVIKAGIRNNVDIDFNTGMDRFSGLWEMALDVGVFKKVGTKVALPNGELKFGAHITPTDFSKETLDAIDAEVQKRYKLGKGDPLPPSVFEVDEDDVGDEGSAE